MANLLDNKYATRNRPVVTSTNYYHNNKLPILMQHSKPAEVSSQPKSSSSSHQYTRRYHHHNYYHHHRHHNQHVKKQQPQMSGPNLCRIKLNSKIFYKLIKRCSCSAVLSTNENTEYYEMNHHRFKAMTATNNSSTYTRCKRHQQQQQRNRRRSIVKGGASRRRNGKKTVGCKSSEPNLIRVSRKEMITHVSTTVFDDNEAPPKRNKNTSMIRESRSSSISSSNSSSDELNKKYKKMNKRRNPRRNSSITQKESSSPLTQAAHNNYDFTTVTSVVCHDKTRRTKPFMILNSSDQSSVRNEVLLILKDYYF